MKWRGQIMIDLASEITPALTYGLLGCGLFRETRWESSNPKALVIELSEPTENKKFNEIVSLLREQDEVLSVSVDIRSFD